MKRIPKARRTSGGNIFRRDIFGVRTPGLWDAAGRLLLLLATALIVFMPWTEYFWHFDRFLQGGQDLELGLLAVVSVLCLALLLAQHCRKGIARIVASIVAIRRAGPGACRGFHGLVQAAPGASLPTVSRHLYRLPMQV